MWVKIITIILLSWVIFSLTYSILKPAINSYKAKLAFRQGHFTFTLDGDETEVSEYTDN
jgi:hypothetical protein